MSTKTVLISSMAKNYFTLLEIDTNRQLLRAKIESSVCPSLILFDDLIIRRKSRPGFFDSCPCVDHSSLHFKLGFILYFSHFVDLFYSAFFSALSPLPIVYFYLIPTSVDFIVQSFIHQLFILFTLFT